MLQLRAGDDGDNEVQSSEVTCLGCTVSGKAKTLTTVPLFTATLSAKYPSASSAQSTPCHGRFCPANRSRGRPASARGNSEIRGWDDVHAEAGAGPSTPVHSHGWAHVAARELWLRTSPGLHEDRKPLPQFFERRTGLPSSEMGAFWLLLLPVTLAT